MPLPFALPALSSLTGGGALTPSNSSSASGGPVQTGAVNVGGSNQTTLILAAVVLGAVFLLSRK